MVKRAVAGFSITNGFGDSSTGAAADIAPGTAATSATDGIGEGTTGAAVIGATVIGATVIGAAVIGATTVDCFATEGLEVGCANHHKAAISPSMRVWAGRAGSF